MCWRIGVSALVMASAEAFTLLKPAGALYLFWLGLKTMRDARTVLPSDAPSVGNTRAFRDGVLVEALNPKTAAFFLAFLPRFVDPSGTVWLQFTALGLISVTLNTAVDVAVVLATSRARGFVRGRPAFVRRLRTGAGMMIAGLGLSLLLTRRPV